MMSNKKQIMMTQSDFLKKATFKYLSKIKIGEILWDDGDIHRFGSQYKDLVTNIKVNNKAFYKKFIWRGSLGAAESYIAGDWCCDNLTVLMQIMLKNESILTKLENGLSSAGHFFRMIINMINYSSIKKSRENIYHHYDLSNDFFKLFLDHKMIYSSAIFNDQTTNLEQAQQNKLSVICERLQLSSNDHLLEIGSGWGALAIYAAQNYQCKVTTTTISDAQYNYVKGKIRTLNLENKISLLKKDYRNLQGEYDKLVSIEMIESIGYQYFNKYFAVCNKLLKKGGIFLLQSIVINDQEYERYKRELDFIKAYIFPGGCLPAIATISTAIKEKTMMLIKEIEDFGSDYAKTLSLWHKNFKKNIVAIKQLGFDDNFIRMFEFYFCYCEAGFLSSYISVIHAVMEKRSC